MKSVKHAPSRMEDEAGFKPAYGSLTRSIFAALSLAAALTASNAAFVRAAPATPDFTGVWGRDMHNFIKPYSGRGQAGRAPVTGGYDNPYLKPWVVEALNRDDLVNDSGHAVVTAHSVCYPESIPYVFGGTQIQILQKSGEITVLYGDPAQFRTIYLNRPHSAHVTPSWYGESVGHFEGDTLVVDTIGLGVHPEAGSMGFFGTPHTAALHVVERYRFLKDGEKSQAPRLRDDAFEASDVIKGAPILRLEFTVDDPEAYKKPWSVILDYVPLKSRIREYVCAENVRDPDLSPFLPTATIPDF